MSEQKNPFNVGDLAVFTPDERTVGWYQHSFERWAIYPGYEGTVTRIDADQVELDGKSDSAMHWSQFRPAADVSQSERDQMAADYRSHVK